MSLASFAKHDSYKDSGVGWIGDVPEHWEMRANKHLFQLEKRTVGKRSSEFDLLSLTLRGLIKRDMENPEGKFPAEFDTYQEVLPGDFVFCLFDVEETPRTVGLSSFAGMITGAYTVYRPLGGSDPKFLYYFYLNADTDKKMRGLYKGLRNTIPKDAFATFKTPLPPLREQGAIASFLDDKCKKIDEAVRIKEAQIALLRERRQILIQEAVTRGLNPDAPMKDSGIDWFGQIPAHWKTLNFRYLIDTLTDFTANGSFADLAKNVTYLDIPDYSRLIRLTDLRRSMTNKGVFLSKASHFFLKKSELFGGELLMANVGAYAGFSCVMPKTEYPASLGPNMLLMRLKCEASVDYITLLLNSPAYWGYLRTAAQSSAQPKLNKENVRAIPIVLPPKDEQDTITAYLKCEYERFDAAIALKQDQITALKEYKTSLINAAVTGKIKVT
ncbi:restriction endonuclease subunit S [Sulfitobacter sp. HNIBRBA2951]|uniref:restriction endonuclease subunit S n=1 Tax=Sulfitobacter aquimarinus TaxID=3158557 RepID=UPI0032DE9438